MASHKVKDKPRFKAAAQIEKSFKGDYAAFLSTMIKTMIENVQFQSNTGTSAVH